MPKGFIPLLEPPSNRRGDLARRPGLCVIVTLGVSLLIFAIFGMSAWNVFTHRFATNTLYFHAGDEISLRQVSNDFSSTFCDKYKVSLWKSGDIFLLPTQAVVNTTVTDSMPVFMYQVPFREYNLKKAYLLTKSIIDVSACREKESRPIPAEIVLISGNDNLEKWRKNSYCRDCRLQHSEIPHDAYCGDVSANKREARLTHVVEHNDNYYLIIFYDYMSHRSREKDAGIFLNGTIARTHFNVMNTDQECHITNDSFCEFSLPWHSHKDIVVRFNSFRSQGLPRTLITSCHIRIEFWVGMFVVLPVVCVIPISVLFGFFLCRRTRRNFDAIQNYGSIHTSPGQRSVRVQVEPPPTKTAEDLDGSSMTIQER